MASSSTPAARRRLRLIVATLVILSLAYWFINQAHSPSRASAGIATATKPQPASVRASRLNSLKTPFAELMALPEGDERRQRFAAWLATLTDAEIPDVAALFHMTSRHDAIDDELGLVLERWVAFDPATALDFTATLLPRDSLLIRPARQALTAWLARDPAHALTYVDTMARDLTEWRSVLVKGAAAILAEKDFSAALTWASRPDSQRNRALEVVAASANTPETRAQIARLLSSLSDQPGDVQDALLQFAPSYAHADPRAALDWVATGITDPALRQTALLETIRQAGQAAPADVATWLHSDALAQALTASGATAPLAGPYVDDLLVNFLLGAAESSDPGYALANLALLTDPTQQDRILRQYYSTLDRHGGDGTWDAPAVSPGADPELLTVAASLRTAVSATLSAQPSALPVHAQPAAYTIATTSGVEPVAASRINSQGAVYSVSSGDAVEFRLANPRRSADTAIVSTLDRDAISVTQQGDQIVFSVQPGQVAIVDYGAGNEVHLSVIAPTASD